MGIYIPGVKLPSDKKYKLDLVLYISYDGTVHTPWGNLITEGKAIELPPHGDLIDRSKIAYTRDDSGLRSMDVAHRAQLENAIPVIPREEE